MSNEKSSTAIDDEKKEATNLCNALVNDSKSAFYKTDKITKTLVRKARNSLYKKDIVFVNIYTGLENKKVLPKKVPLNVPFANKKKNICALLYSFSRPFEALQADIAYISFLARSAVYYLLICYFKYLYIPHEKTKSFSKKKKGIIW